MALSYRQVLDLVLGAGFRDQDAVKAVAIASAESSLDPSKLNPRYWTRGQLMPNGKYCDQNFCGDYSIGLFQINMRPDLRNFRLSYFSLPSLDALYDPATNARVAFKLYTDKGRGFGDWSTYINGDYNRHMPGALTAWAQYQAEQATPAVIPPPEVISEAPASPPSLPTVNPPSGLPHPATASPVNLPQSPVGLSRWQSFLLSCWLIWQRIKGAF